MTNDVSNKILDVFADAVAERLVGNEAFVTTLATALSGKLQRPVVLDDEVVLVINKRMDEYLPQLRKEVEEIVERTAEEKISEAMSDLEIETDNVSGLERFVEDAVENGLDSAEIDADRVTGLDRAIEEAFSDAEIDAEKVRGLDDAITETIMNNSDLKKELRKTVLSGLSITVDAKVDGKSIEGVDIRAV